MRGKKKNGGIETGGEPFLPLALKPMAWREKILGACVGGMVRFPNTKKEKGKEGKDLKKKRSPEPWGGV